MSVQPAIMFYGAPPPAHHSLAVGQGKTDGHLTAKGEAAVNVLSVLALCQ